MFMLRLLDSIKHSPNLSAIEGSLIDIFLGLLVSSDDYPAAVSQTTLAPQRAMASFKLHPEGAMEIINYLKLIMESTRVNVSTFFSTEVAIGINQRIVVSLIRKIAVKQQPGHLQVEAVVNTLVIILEKLLESSPQVIPYFIESYLREFLIRIEESTSGAFIFDDLQRRFGQSLTAKSQFTSSSRLTQRTWSSTTRLEICSSRASWWRRPRTRSCGRRPSDCRRSSTTSRSTSRRPWSTSE